MDASSSSSLAGEPESENYEVFISFRGSDVRAKFLCHLNPALKARQINVFIDKDLDRGKDIALNLFQIIEQADLSIVIFSPNYPRSKWCLEELEKIHESLHRRNQIVVPVFYGVNPSHVQDLKGNYAIQSQKWKDALAEISNLSGFDSSNVDDAELIKNIVADVSMRLREICPTITREDGFFGIDSRVEDVESLLLLDSTNDVRMVGIWGLGGIGKTTLASKVFEKIKNKFSGYFFAPNVRETSMARDGLINLLNKIIAELLMDKDIRTYSPFPVDGDIARRLKRIKVLLVLDDVDSCMLMKHLLQDSGLSNSLCQGSRIILTSRDLLVLTNVTFKSAIYEVKQLEDDKALQILSWNAFGQNKPQQGYEEISKELVRYAHGVPLALVVLGSQLKGKPIRHWEDFFKKVVSCSPLEIQKILRISFDGLDKEEKNIFLDIACLFKGCSKDSVVYELENFGYHANIGIERLVDKSLLRVVGVYFTRFTITKMDFESYGDTVITMHDLLQQMGHEIVAEEKDKQGKQSRLWNFDDIKDALTNDTGTENVEVIVLNDFCGDELNISCEAFIRMHKLRYLSLVGQKISFPTGLKFLPNSIRILRWKYYPLRYFPSDYNADKLVVLEMHESQLEEINWSKPLMNLKRLDVSYSKKLTRISGLAMASNLQELVLACCHNLVEVGSSLENLNKLTSLSVECCESLSHLPELPCSIQELILDGSGLRGLPSTIGRLTLLIKLSLISCKRLNSLPNSICALSSIEKFVLSCCSLPKFPEGLGNLDSLKELHFFSCAFRELPQFISNLQNLTELVLTGCGYLMKLPEDFGNLESLEKLEVTISFLRELPQSIQNLKNLTKLRLSCCFNLMKLPEDFGNLESLKELDASHSDLRELPQSVRNLKNLANLNLSGCRSLVNLQDDIGNLESLQELDASDSGLIELPESIRNLKNLIKLHLTGCMDLQYIPVLPCNLEEFYAAECKSLSNQVLLSTVHQFLNNRACCQRTKAFRLYVNGSQVPDWMEYRNECGSSVSVELEALGHSMYLIFCSVSSPNRSIGFSLNDYLCAILQSDEVSREWHHFGETPMGLGFLRQASDITFLWTCYVDCRFINKVSFDSNEEIIKCGVHPIFHTINGRKRPHPDSPDLGLHPLVER